MKGITTIAILVIMVMMSGMAGAAMLEEDLEYGTRNVAPEGIEHVLYDFEEGSNLYPFKNAHPGVASFETVESACFGANEPSYVKQGASSCGAGCRCKMYIYPTPYEYVNGTPFPYIHIVNGYTAFSPRCIPLPDGCYWPGCRAFIGLKEDTHFVSFLVSTNSGLFVRAYDPKGNYLDSTTIYCTTERVDDGPSNFTRYTLSLPENEIGWMTFSGPFNGWHIDDLIIGGELGYLGNRRYYGWAAERMRQLIGAEYNELGLGYLLHTGTLLTAKEILDDKADPYYNPFTGEMEFGVGICPEAAIIWAYNEDVDFVNHLCMDDQEKKDFMDDVPYEEIQPGDVFFVDYPGLDPKTDMWVPDGRYDEVGIVIPEQCNEVTGELEDCIRIVPGGGVHYDSTKSINDLYGTDGFVDYRCLPDEPRIGKSPYPRIPGKPI